MSAKIQIRRDTAANWASANPTLAVGEIAYETDSRLVKVGDGSTIYTALAYTQNLHLGKTSQASTATLSLFNTDRLPYIELIGTATGVTALNNVPSSIDQYLVLIQNNSDGDINFDAGVLVGPDAVDLPQNSAQLFLVVGSELLPIGGTGGGAGGLSNDGVNRTLDFTAEEATEYLVDNSGGTLEIEMPVGAEGVRVRLVDPKGTWNVSSPTVVDNGLPYHYHSFIYVIMVKNIIKNVIIKGCTRLEGERSYGIK